MKKNQSLLVAPFATFPVTLLFFLLRSLLEGDLRELLVAPYSAMVISIFGYPFAIVVVWIFWRIGTMFENSRLSIIFALAVAIVSAETIFWLVISPFWQRDFSNAFLVILVGVCCLACGAYFFWLVKTKAALGD